MEDKYIQLLKKAKEDFESNKPINFDDFKERLKAYDIKTDPNWLWNQIYNPGTADYDQQVMTLEPYFKLLEYDELNEARKDSKQAKIYAIIAISFASVFALIQIIIAINGC